jgi:hypothetical protein
MVKSPIIGLDTKTYWLTDRQSQCDSDSDSDSEENPFYTRKHCEIKRITNVPDRATARRGGAQLVHNKF